MRAGKLDQVVTIQQAATADDAFGQPIETWSTFATRRARIINESGDAFFQNERETTRRAIRLQMRYLSGVTEAMRFQMSDGRAYEIKEVVTLGRNRGTELRGVFIDG